VVCLPNAPATADPAGHSYDIILQECIANRNIQCYDGKNRGNKGKYGSAIISGKSSGATQDNIFNAIKAMDQPGR
jgi:hypothetical protein